MKFSLHPVTSDMGPFQVLRRSADAIRAAGHSVVEHADQPPRRKGADCWIVHQSFAAPMFLDPLPDRSVILMERIDSAQLWSREQAEHPSVLACPKPAALPVEMLLRDDYRNHETTLVGDKSMRGLGLLSKAAAEKVCPGPHYGQYDRIGRFEGQDPNMHGERDIDVFFAGSTSIYQDTINAHRAACCASINFLGDEYAVKCVPSKSLHRHDYDALTRRSRVVVSPWGNGELCHRDFDAMWCGAVLVKPMSDHLRTDPLMFKDGITYFACKPDWSDLREVVANVIGGWGELLSMREANYGRVKAAYRPEYVAAWLDRLVRNN